MRKGTHERIELRIREHVPQISGWRRRTDIAIPGARRIASRVHFRPASPEGDDVVFLDHVTWVQAPAEHETVFALVGVWVPRKVLHKALTCSLSMAIGTRPSSSRTHCRSPTALINSARSKVIYT